MVSAKWEVHTVGQRAGLAILLRSQYTSLIWRARHCAFLMRFQVMPRLYGPLMHFASKGWRSLPSEPLGEEGFWELVRAENSFLICWTPREWTPEEIQPSDATLRGKHDSPARGGSAGGKSEYTSRLFVPPKERGTDLVLVEKYIFSCPNHRLTARLAQVKFLRWPLSTGLPLLALPQVLPPASLGQPSRPPFPCPVAGPQPLHPGAQHHLPSQANALMLWSPSRERKLCTPTLKWDPYNYLSILACPVLLYHCFFIAKVARPHFKYIVQKA